MSPWTSSLVSIAIVSVIPLAATVLLATKAETVRHFLPHLTAFGAGALLGAAVVHLIPEALRGGQSPTRVFAGIAIGFLAFAVVERLLAHRGDGTSQPGADLAGGVTPSLIPLVFAGDTIHNLVDGMLIAAGFLANPAFGLLTAVAIGLHELPREIGTYGMFVHGGVRPLRAVGFNIFTAMFAFLGAAATLAIGSRVSNFGESILPFAAGSYLYIALAIGRPVLSGKSIGVPKNRDATWLASGFAVMGISAYIAHVF